MSCTYEIHLLKRFSLTRAGAPVRLQLPAQRVLALLALDGERSRAGVSETLWPDHPPERSSANLRSAMWKMRQTAGSVLAADRSSLRLSDDASVDVACAERLAQALLAPDAPDARATVAPMRSPQWALLTCDILPDWDEDWLLVERERFRQLRLHALEALAHTLIMLRRSADAVDVAACAVTAEPLRESAQFLLIAAHLGEGNYCEAVEQYRKYSDLLRRELGIAPGARVADLVRRCRSAVPQHGPDLKDWRIPAPAEVAPRVVHADGLAASTWPRAAPGA